MTSVDFEKVLNNKIPPDAIAYCVSLFEEQPFQFKITRNRKSKSGDYRYDKKTDTSVVTVNSGMNKYSFLITLIHEIAHHSARLKYHYKINPHGSEWKAEFRNLMLPLVDPLIFPEDLLRILAKHLKSPKASTWADSKLYMVLRSYNENLSEIDEHHLEELEEGNTFSFNDRLFTKLSKRRTRVLCQECSTGRKYLIPKQALVKMV